MNSKPLDGIIMSLSSLLILLVCISTAYSQVGISCASDDNNVVGHLPQAKTVFYTFVGITGTQKTQIETAFSTWQSANTTQNCSRVSFQEGIAPVGGVTITISNKALNNAASNFQSSYSTPSNEISSAQIFFDLNFKIQVGPDLVNYYDLSKGGYGTIFTKMALHEIGHLMGLSHYSDGHPDSCQSGGDNTKYQKHGLSVMNDGCNPNDVDGNIATSPTDCDNPRVSAIYPCPTPTPTPTPTIEPPTMFPNCDTSGLHWFCHRESVEYCNCKDFAGEWDNNNCVCIYRSPIVIDINGDGFALTSAVDGVRFDLDSNQVLEQTAWTSADSDDAWLALDRSGNGLIDDGTELFGNFTSQPAAPEGEKKNGFLALAEYDKTQNGGNRDGALNKADAIFSSLRLWRDKNHNGVSEASELKTLSSLNVATMELDYKESKRTDEFGNRFRYRAKVKDSKGAQVGRWAWDVFLVSQ